LTEYALEIYNDGTDKFVTQVDVYSTLKEAEQSMLEMPHITGCHYRIMMIEYDQDGNEINVERL
jgi:hypothetical protein